MKKQKNIYIPSIESESMEMEMGSNIKKNSSSKKEDLFHVIHKVPAGDGPYVRAKHAQVSFLINSFILITYLINTLFIGC